MKFFENTFDEYINKNQNLHPYLQKYINKLGATPKDIMSLNESSSATK